MGDLQEKRNTLRNDLHQAQTEPELIQLVRDYIFKLELEDMDKRVSTLHPSLRLQIQELYEQCYKPDAMLRALREVLDGEISDEDLKKILLPETLSNSDADEKMV